MQLLEFTIARHDRFTRSSTSTGAANYRESSVLFELEQWGQYFENAVRNVLPDILPVLELPPFFPSQVEAQITAHGDGGFYRWHTDNGSLEVKTRYVTFVYYFNLEPKVFTGGNLEIESDGQRKTIVPENNTIVFFRSSLNHQVTEVQLEPNLFENSRFTVNGWVRS